MFGIYDSGQYRLQPIYIDDLAVAAVDHITQPVNEIIDAIGPETYSYREMVEMIAARDRLARPDRIDAADARLPSRPRAWLDGWGCDQHVR
ncbi:MAG TPA: hypothetical protein VKB89_32955 [Xanthobacteraceae bacterium]|nr:hypothetical protein [Xanthobacteraceae bacterium]